MTVSEALYNRRSMRAFKQDPVPREILTKILKDAAQSPSWANSQPWEVFVAEGETLRRVRAAYADCYAKSVKPEPELSRPAEWTDAAKKRQKSLYPDMVRDCGEAAAQQFGALNQRMFDAPCVVFLCKDKILNHWSVFDLGAYSQSLMLSALENGLGSIVAVTLVSYPGVLRKELKIPDNLQIAVGIALGYTDEKNAINNFRSARSPIEENVRFCE
jgi:nitroreductase